MHTDPAFDDLANPTPAEITAWAYTAEAMAPMEDWDLILADADTAPLLLTLVADQTCPHRRYLLRSLYVIVGDAVRSNYGTTSAPSLDSLLHHADQFTDPWITTWVHRSRALITAPETFTYDAWCDGGLSRDPIDPPG